MRAPAASLPLASALVLLCAGLLALSLSGCGGRGGPGADQANAQADSDSTAAGEEDPAVPVEVAVIERGPIESVLRSTATLEAEEQVTVFAEAARRVTEIRAEEGDRVDKGQLLLRLQDAEQRSAVAKARTLYEQAEREWRRQERLREQQLTTDIAYNDALASYEQRKLELADAERELGYTEVRAPIGGTVTRRFVKLGDQVNVGQQLFEIIDFETLQALVYIPEKDLGELAVGQPARVTAPAIREAPFEAEVLRVSPIVDARTGTVKVTVDVGGQPGLRPGLYVDVALVTSVEPDAVLVPKRALVYENDQMYAFRVRGDEVERLRLVPVMSNRDHIMPASGVAAGDSLVTAGQAGLKTGARIEIVERQPAPGEQS